MKKILFIIIIFIIVFILYILFYNNKIMYVSLGDSLAIGKNAYGVVDYGYSDYVKDYLEDNNKLKYYTKEFAKDGYRITDIINDIELNKKIKVEKNMEGIKTILRRSNLLTISVGSNDLLYKINGNLDNINNNEINNYINELISDYDKLLDNVTKYFKGELIIIGYYNPYINNANYVRKLENSFFYIYNNMQKLCDKYGAKYINIYEIFIENPDYIPNDNDIHPSKEGYEQIANLIIDVIEK